MSKYEILNKKIELKLVIFLADTLSFELSFDHLYPPPPHYKLMKDLQDLKRNGPKLTITK